MRRKWVHVVAEVAAAMHTAREQHARWHQRTRRQKWIALGR